MPGLIEQAALHPDQPAVVFGDGDECLTYGALEERSRKIALWLRDKGFEAGDCVAMLFPNSTSLFEFYWATQRIGLYLTPLNWHSTPEEITYILDNCDAKLMVASAALSDLAEKSAILAGASLAYASMDGPIRGFENVDKALEEYSSGVSLDTQPVGSVMIYSSGTTGKPKGIRRPLPGNAFDDAAFVDATTLVMRTFGFEASDVYLCPAPLYHAGPLRSCSAMHMLGATVIVMHRFDASKALEAIEQHRVTVAQFVPTHFKRMLDLPDEERARWDHTTLRVAVHAAAPCPPQVKRAMIEWWGPILLEYYAGTEGGGVMISAEEWLEKPGSVGRPWSGLDLAIRDDSDAMTTKAGHEGLIYFRNTSSSGLNFEYHKDPEKTAAAHFGEWFTLGDIGYLDEDGFLFLTDRQTNIIISGGVNIYPQEAEDALVAHPKVHDAAVVGVPDEGMGEAVKAVIVPASPGAAGPALERELIEYTHSQMAKYKCPRSIDFVDALPRTDTGKLKKRLVREQYWKDQASSLSG